VFGWEFGVWVSCVQQVFGLCSVLENFKTVLGLVSGCMRVRV
jgi:hypothetical protein